MNLKIRSNILLLLISLILLLSCGGGSSGPEPVGPLKQKYFFVIERYNTAFTQTFHGISIDNNGDVYFFMLDQFPSPEPEPVDGLFPESYYDNIFNDRKTYLETIDENIFSNMTSLIQSATVGNLTEPINGCSDTGVYRYSVFEFNSFTGLYKKITVYTTGEIIRIKQIQAAIDIRDWLIQIAIDNQIAFAGSICTGDFTSLNGP